MNEATVTPSESSVEVELSSIGTSTGVEREYDDETYSESITHPFDPTDIEITTRNRTIHLLMEQIRHEELNLTPDFQRKAGIWSRRQMSRLIESIMLRIPLPMFYISEDDEGAWLVVDGLQRLSTLKQFIIEASSFELRGLEFLAHFERMRFEDLPRKMQRRILETEVVLHVVQPGTPKAVVRTIFQRINTGGLPLSSQEIRHALYQGKSTRMLKDLAESPEFKLATAGSIKDDRMADRECALRALAFIIHDVEDYVRKDQDGFLSETMEHFNRSGDEYLAELSYRMRSALLVAHNIFGNEAFRKRYVPSSIRYPINKALFETWCAVLAKQSSSNVRKLEENREEVVKLFTEMLAGNDYPELLASLSKRGPRWFHDSISQDTSEVGKVRARFTAVSTIVEACLS